MIASAVQIAVYRATEPDGPSVARSITAGAVLVQIAGAGGVRAVAAVARHPRGRP